MHVYPSMHIEILRKGWQLIVLLIDFPKQLLVFPKHWKTAIKKETLLTLVYLLIRSILMDIGALEMVMLMS